MKTNDKKNPTTATATATDAIALFTAQAVDYAKQKGTMAKFRETLQEAWKALSKGKSDAEKKAIGKAIGKAMRDAGIKPSTVSEAKKDIGLPMERTHKGSHADKVEVDDNLVQWLVDTALEKLGGDQKKARAALSRAKDRAYKQFTDKE